MSNPHSFSSGTEKALFRLALGKCYFPGCQKSVIEEVNGHPVVGVQIAHIRGAEPSSARYDPLMTDKERAAFPNLILLCQPHHTYVDRVDPHTYPAAVLEEWKEQNEPVEGLRILRELTLATLESQIEAAVLKVGTLRLVKVDVSWAVRTGPTGWVDVPYSVIPTNESLQNLPIRFCVNVVNEGLADVSIDAIQILTELSGATEYPRYLPDIPPSDLYPQLPYRLRSGDAKAWLLPLEVFSLLDAGLAAALGRIDIASVFTLIRLATGEESESGRVPWTEVLAVVQLAGEAD